MLLTAKNVFAKLKSVMNQINQINFFFGFYTFFGKGLL